jgi:hypothetical protein
MKKIKFKFRYIMYALICLALISIVVDFIRISGYETIPSLPQNEKRAGITLLYYDLVNGKKDINWDLINSSLEYVNKQYDVSDFRMATLMRILYEYKEQIPPEKLSEIKRTVLKFRYWMDEPGENAMCYWSENHQILFASAEYLAGQLYPDEKFLNSNLTGRQHILKARKRVLDWLEMRWKYGFSEYYSTVYYNEDIAGIINLIDFAQDQEIVKKSEIIMDLLIYDIASQKLGNTFVSVSGRAYENSRKGGEKLSSGYITNYIWNNQREIRRPHLNYSFIASKKYIVPPLLKDIGNDTSTVIIKQGNGLDVSSLAAEGYGRSDDRSIMMQWGMEAFSNPEVIRNTMDYVRRNNMFSNEFLVELRPLDYSLIRLFHLEPLIIKLVDPQSNGTAIQRAYTYTYRTKYYSVYSVQNYNPGYYANQDHVAGMNAGTSFSVFHTHPAPDKSLHDQSPNYWVGYGRLPHTAQNNNISLSIYNLPDRANMFELSMLHFTHAYFPKDKFDTVVVSGSYAFGKKGKTYCALIGTNKLYYKKGTTDDLLQQGKQVYWIIQGGSEEEDGSFGSFCSRIKQNKISFDRNKLILSYTDKGIRTELKYKSGLYVNGSHVNTNYGRYDSPYIKTDFNPDSLIFRQNKKYLKLNFYRGERVFN